MDAWCREHNLILTGHFLHEDNLTSQVAMNGSMMVWFSGLNKTSDEAGFIVVYPSGTGIGPLRTWNAGGFPGKAAESGADDVAYIGKLLDDLGTVVNIDEKRVYACSRPTRCR